MYIFESVVAAAEETCYFWSNTFVFTVASILY
uniref:Uncharacterized protein n=1 Tax=Anguilla anguilla TaxID=7936 RepID=A0A0E9UNU8_ANGAN